MMKILDFILKSPDDVDVSTATLEEMAKNAGLSKWHFHRVFKRILGVTPNEYAKGMRNVSTSRDASTLSPNGFGNAPITGITSEQSSSVNTLLNSPWSSVDLLSNFSPVRSPGNEVQLFRFVS